MLEMVLVENIQREDLDSIEIALSYQRLMEECALTQEKVSGRVGKKRATITNYLRLLKLPPEIQLGIRDRRISMGHARSIINIDDPDIQLKVYNKIIKDGLSVRKTEELVRKAQEEANGNGENNGQSKRKNNEEIPKEYEELKSELRDYLKTNVDFKRNTKGAGKIIIPFKSDEDLERIMAFFTKRNT
jgi:ParB family chromosome partitioning protein